MARMSETTLKPKPGTGQAESSRQVLPAPRGLPFEKNAAFGLFSSHKANVKHAFSSKIQYKWG